MMSPASTAKLNEPVVARCTVEASLLRQSSTYIPFAPSQPREFLNHHFHLAFFPCIVSAFCVSVHPCALVSRKHITAW